MNLYEISEKLTTLIEEAFDIETGELYETQEELDKAIDACALDLDTKFENIGCFIKNLKAESEALKKEEDNLKRRRKTVDNKIESLENYVNGYLKAVYPNDADRAKWKFKTAKVALGCRRSTTVEVPNIEVLDEKYIRTKIEKAPDKTMLKELLKKGEKIKGAYLQENINLSVK